MDRIRPDVRSATMRSIRSKDMKPELAVRRMVFSWGYRYRLHRHDLPGRPDMVFPGRRKVIFVHGCFWHQHQDPDCRLVHAPRSRLEYWEPKLRRNQERDTRHLSRLEELGWAALVLWECQVRSDGERLRETIDGFLNT